MPRSYWRGSGNGGSMMLDLTPRQLATVRAILHARLPRREVRAFGSRVSGLARRYSDLDLMLMGEEEIPDLLRTELREDFDESDLPFRVDLVLWRDVPPALRTVVERGGVVIQPVPEGQDVSPRGFRIEDSAGGRAADLIGDPEGAAERDGA